MKSNTRAIYQGKEYSAGLRDDKSIILRSGDINDEHNGFTIHNGPNPNVKCIKYVSREDIDEIYDVVTTANYQGYSFDVIGDDGYKILLCTMTLDYRICENLRMECIDKGVYQKWINKREAKIKVKKEML